MFARPVTKGFIPGWFAAEQDASVEAANKTAQRAEAMTEQNRSALRALNDKIDRMFRTISRK